MAENKEIKTEEGEKKGEQKSAWGLLKKFLKWGAVILVIVWGLLIWVGNNTEELDKKIENWRSARYEKALQKYTDEMKARYAADTDGGKTPEETLDLFIAALKAGDIEKASKYYVLEKQEKELGHLKNDILGKYGDLQKSIDFYTEVKEKGTKKCNEKGDGCTFEYEYIRSQTSTTTTFISGQNLTLVSPAGSKGRKLIDVGLNNFSGVWKIELP